MRTLNLVRFGSCLRISAVTVGRNRFVDQLRTRNNDIEWLARCISPLQSRYDRKI